jgi:hypothetical protein
MVCQYPRAGPVSREKHEVMLGSEMEAWSGDPVMVGTGTEGAYTGWVRVVGSGGGSVIQDASGGEGTFI